MYAETYNMQQQVYLCVIDTQDEYKYKKLFPEPTVGWIIPVKKYFTGGGCGKLGANIVIGR